MFNYSCKNSGCFGFTDDPSGCPEEHNHRDPHVHPYFTNTECNEFLKREFLSLRDNFRKLEVKLDERLGCFINESARYETEFKTSLSEGYHDFIKEVTKEINLFESRIENSLSLFISEQKAEFKAMLTRIETLEEHHKDFDING